MLNYINKWQQNYTICHKIKCTFSLMRIAEGRHLWIAKMNDSLECCLHTYAFTLFVAKCIIVAYLYLSNVSSPWNSFQREMINIFTCLLIRTLQKIAIYYFRNISNQHINHFDMWVNNYCLETIEKHNVI